MFIKYLIEAKDTFPFFIPMISPKANMNFVSYQAHIHMYVQ